uniref:Uncharacterized protein n=1 Tax=Schizaphis graminum TaxID=13262 RepID=A0A2S2PRM5_SCHGA
MNRGPIVAQSLPVDRYAGNCLIKPSSSSSYYCGGGLHNAQLEPPRCRYDAVAGVSAAYHHGAPTPYQHYQQLQDWYGRAAYWHHHHQHQNGVVGTVGVSGGGGGPLAEKANFAAHKHGAPLIQAAKYNRTGSGGGGGGGPGKKYAKKAPAEQPNCNGGKKNDGGSDESSGAASENSLPRIIKPRKRRKKERKPVPAVQPLVAATAASAPPERAVADRPPSTPSSVSSSTSSSPPPPPVSELGMRDAAPFDTIRLSADIKAVSLEDVSTCQCACCDPVGNVWDVGRRCFSPSLTRPEPARRSWSGEPTSPTLQSSSQYFKIAAAVEYAKTETAAPAARSRTHSLEVSSEIVTSHNGHRDIEIKFFTMPIGHHR